MKFVYILWFTSQGFELLDPFIPVEVPKLSEMEFHSMLDYYEDRRFLQRLGGREEMEFLTARVARDLRKIVAGLWVKDNIVKQFVICYIN